MTIVMPGAMRSTSTRRSPAPSRTRASEGVRSINARMALRARSRVRASSACASAKRKTTVAASDHWPRRTAPAAATSIRTLMSSDPTRKADHAFRAVTDTPAANDRAKAAMAHPAMLFGA
jgi:hypothetical protein